MSIVKGNRYSFHLGLLLTSWNIEVLPPNLKGLPTTKSICQRHTYTQDFLTMSATPECVRVWFEGSLSLLQCPFTTRVSLLICCCCCQLFGPAPRDLLAAKGLLTFHQVKSSGRKPRRRGGSRHLDGFNKLVVVAGGRQVGPASANRLRHGGHCCVRG